MAEPGTHLRAAIIGCGRMGGTIDDEVRAYPGMLFPYGHAPAYQAAPGVELVAAADSDPGRLAAFCDRFGIGGRFADYRAMLAAVHPDIVSVTTPATTRAEIVCAAAGAGVRAIYAEKALACSLAETEAIAQACAEAGVALNIGTSRRYHPAYRAARQMIGEGAVGEPRLALAHAGGSLMHTHSHTVDTLLFLLGDPPVLEVRAGLDAPADGGRFAKDPGVLWADLRCAGGLRAHLFAGARYEFEVVGSAGALQLYNNGLVETWRLRRPGSRRQSGLDVWESHPFPIPDLSVSPTLRCVQELASAVRDGAPTSGGLPVGRRQMEVAIAMAVSDAAGGAAVGLDGLPPTLFIPSR